MNSPRLIIFHEKHGDSHVLFEHGQLAEVLAAQFDFNLEHHPYMYDDIADASTLSSRRKAEIMSQRSAERCEYETYTVIKPEVFGK